jgi:hypothetical protein
VPALALVLVEPHRNSLPRYAKICKEWMKYWRLDLPKRHRQRHAGYDNRNRQTVRPYQRLRRQTNALNRRVRLAGSFLRLASIRLVLRKRYNPSWNPPTDPKKRLLARSSRCHGYPPQFKYLWTRALHMMFYQYPSAPPAQSHRGLRCGRRAIVCEAGACDIHQCGGGHSPR